MSGSHRHATNRTDWTVIAECPNNGDCEPIMEAQDLDEPPMDCTHLVLEAEANNSDVDAEDVFPVEECGICGAELDFIIEEEQSEVLY